ncbi:MAG: dephospho-CoA kinase [Thermodesulfobacteriota bacterium]
MKVIGLTGNIASGKSSVAAMFEGLGARIIDADEIARLVVEPGKPAWNEIIDRFGKDILEPGGTIDRKKLGEIIFNDQEKRMTLNEITHPRIIGKIREVVNEGRKENIPVVIIEAALIVEKGGLRDLIDGLIVVTADEETQIGRLIREKGYSRKEAVSRLSAQMPAREKVKFADYIIDNSGPLETTRKQVLDLWEVIRDSG